MRSECGEKGRGILEGGWGAAVVMGKRFAIFLL